MSFDPLTGSGLNRAVSAAETAAQLVSEFLRTGQIQDMQQAALTTVRTFSNMLEELVGYYAVAVRNRPELDGLFWQRRTGGLNAGVASPA